MGLQRWDHKESTAKRWFFALLIAIPMGILLNMLYRYATGQPFAGLFQVIAWTSRGLRYPRSTIYIVVAITTPTIYACYVSRPSSLRGAFSRVFAVAVVLTGVTAVTGAVAFFLVPIGAVVIAGLIDADPAERPYALALPIGVIGLIVAGDARFSLSMALVLFVLLVFVVPIVYDRLVDGTLRFLHATIGIICLSLVTTVAYLLTLLVGLHIEGVQNPPLVTFQRVLVIGPAFLVGTAAPTLVAGVWRRARAVF